MLTCLADAANYFYTKDDNGTTKILEQGDSFTLELIEYRSASFIRVLAPNKGIEDVNSSSLINSLSDGLQLISNETFYRE
jgi:hypothetical protein